MKKVVATYKDVVVPGELPQPKPIDTPTRSKSMKKASKKSGSSTRQKSEKGGKDEMGGEAIAKRAEKLAEDPYATPSEMSAMSGGTKEQEKKADSSDGNQDESENSQKSGSQEARRELNAIVERADKILFRAKTLFPFDLFPDTVTIDANKVDITLKSFFWTETMTSVMLKEIMDVRVHTALFMAKLIIDYGPHPLKIKTVYVTHLWRPDALKAKEIIEGMLVLYRGENIDTTKLRPEDTIREVKEIGKIEEG